MRNALAALVVTTLATGCGTTVAAAFGSSRTPKLYGGVRLDAEVAKSDPVMIPYALVDLPLSFAADTVLVLPYTLKRALR